MIGIKESVCDMCGHSISNDDPKFTDNGTLIIGNPCLCEFCYLNLRRVI